MTKSPPVNRSRRRLLAASVGGVAALPVASWLLSRPVHAAWPQAAFAARTAEDALRELFGGAAPEPSDRIRIALPDVAEDGAVVPLIARFEFGEGALTDSLATRIKLAESEHVIVVVQTPERLYSARRQVEVLIGGCS